MNLTFSTTLKFQEFQKGYSIIMFSMWGIGVDIPRLAMRYFKAYPFSINFHSISMVMIGLFTLMYVIAEIAMYQAKYGSSYTDLSGVPYAQFITSILLTCMVLVQFLLGFLARVKMFKSKLSRTFFGVKLTHKLFGYALYILGKVVATLIVKSTIGLTDDTTFRGWLFCMAGFGIVFIILQVVYRSQSRTIMFPFFFKHKNKQAKYHNQIYQNLIEKRDKFDNFKAKGVRYVLIDNCMYYIDENFMHPGGEAIFNILNGREINFYLKGAKAIAPNYPRHLHTKYVAKYLQNRIIGEIGVDSLVINQKISTDIVDWKIVSAVKSNYAGAWVITFQTDAGNIREELRLQNFGKYIMMGCSTEEILSKTERPYYLCFSLADHQRNVLDTLRKYYKYYYFKEEIEEEQVKKAPEEVSKQLCFFVKEIKYGNFTKFMLNAPKDRIFSINGPYGKGLNLRPKTKGYYILIANDMGVTAFIDFLNFLLQKALFELIKAKASSPSLRKINSGNNNNYEALSDLKVLLVGSFINSGEFYLSTVIKQLYYLNRKHGLKTFDLMLHYSNGETEQEIKMVRDIIGKEFFTNLVQEQQPDQIIFSGSQQLQQSLRKVESQLKLKNPIQFI